MNAFIRIAPDYRAPAWEIDITHIFEAGLRACDPMELASQSEDRVLQTVRTSAYPLLENLFEYTGTVEWIETNGLMTRIKATAKGRPYVFWDRDDLHLGDPKHILDFVAWDCRYGPKLLVDYLRKSAAIEGMTISLLSH